MASAVQLESMPSDKELTAHALRRTSFGPFPGQVEEFAKGGAAGVIDSALSAKPVVPSDKYEYKEDYGESMTHWWIERMLNRTPSLHEKMTWYWHSHLVSGLGKANEQAMWRQHVTIRKHALGNFRELLKAVVLDAAMLSYLDAIGSRADNPNENLARELLELFTLGPGNYAEPDIRAAARVLSGWTVDDKSLKTTWSAEAGYDRPVAILGNRRSWNSESLLDALCDMPQCAKFVATRIYRYFVGNTPSDGRAEELGAVFRKANLELRPLMEHILRSKDFYESVHGRSRTPVEWMVGAWAATGNTKQNDKFKFELYRLDQLGQVPFRPPNVAGWPIDARWVSPGQMLLRTSTVSTLPIAKAVIDRLEPSVDAVLTHCGLYDVSEATRRAMQRALDAQTEFNRGLEMLLTIALVSPEYSLA